MPFGSHVSCDGAFTLYTTHLHMGGRLSGEPTVHTHYCSTCRLLHVTAVHARYCSTSAVHAGYCSTSAVHAGYCSTSAVHAGYCSTSAVHAHYCSTCTLLQYMHATCMCVHVTCAYMYTLHALLAHLFLSSHTYVLGYTPRYTASIAHLCTTCLCIRATGPTHARATPLLCTIGIVWTSMCWYAGVMENIDHVLLL